MSNKEILEKAIQKAIDGGWTGCYVTHSTTNRWDVTSVPKLCVSFSTGGNAYFHPNEVLFNHDFAKTLWGDRYFNAYEDDQAVTEEFECMDAYVCDLHAGPRWKIHLRNMVVSEDPIKYLGEHLDVQKQD